MAFSEDLDVFINDDTPGYTTLKIDYADVSGIFDDEYEEVSFTESSNPRFIVKTSDIPDITQDCNVQNDDGKEWVIVNMQPDNSGVTVLELRVKWHT